MIPGETVLSGAKNPGTEPQIMTSPAGIYVGFAEPDGAPYSRETIYLPDMRVAKVALAHVVLGLLDPNTIPQSPYIRTAEFRGL